MTAAERHAFDKAGPGQSERLHGLKALLDEKSIRQLCARGVRPGWRSPDPIVTTDANGVATAPELTAGHQPGPIEVEALVGQGASLSRLPPVGEQQRPRGPDDHRGSQGRPVAQPELCRCQPRGLVVTCYEVKATDQSEPPTTQVTATGHGSPTTVTGLTSGETTPSSRCSSLAPRAPAHRPWPRTNGSPGGGANEAGPAGQRRGAGVAARQESTSVASAPRQPAPHHTLGVSPATSGAKGTLGVAPTNQPASGASSTSGEVGHRRPKVVVGRGLGGSVDRRGGALEAVGLTDRGPRKSKGGPGQ
jgi:hypothetical protein